MAKKKKSIDYSKENILFEHDQMTKKLMRYDLNRKFAEVKIVEPPQKGLSEISFAHLPKEIKKIVQPLK